MELDANIVIAEYQGGMGEKTHENIVLKAMVKQLSTEIKELKDNIQKLEDKLSPTVGVNGTEELEKARAEQ